MKICPECSTENPDSAKFCLECGTEIKDIRRPTDYPEPQFNSMAHTDNLKFIYPWRPYQRRVLDAVEAHLADHKIHIVAAPGSGKTTLGIEIFRRLGRRALVLSPTRTIRNQWIDRLKHFTADSTDDWTSLDLDKLADFSSITYQAIHTRFKSETEDSEPDVNEVNDDPLEDVPSDNEIDDLVNIIHKNQVGVLILDEAHHLRSEWWKALTKVLELLPYIKLVSLTATPPYDVSGHEWKKYHDLCGPIDEEISVPELVHTGTLAPHQDFIWTVYPFKKEEEVIKQYAEDVKQVCDALFESNELLAVVKAHPLLTQHKVDIDALLDNSNVMMSILVYLKARGEPLPEQVLLIMDLNEIDIPDLTRQWWETLIRAFLFDKNWIVHEAGEEYRTELKRYLRSKHLLWRRELRLTKSRIIKSRLTLSSSKIKACVDIHTEERRVRGESLRQVILTDFIRDQYQPGDPDPVLGAWPVFSALLAGIDGRTDMAMITGRLSIIHRDKLATLQQAYGVKPLTTKTVSNNPEYIQIVESGSNIVAAFTNIFINGDLHVLVGTRSLLGEGWDAPCINSLVLASFVGSYMLTNQMRGRAIRVDKNDPAKVASIWHIVAIAPLYWAGLVDLTELSQRFNTFVGLSEREEAIENGLTRLKIPYLDKFNNFIQSTMRLKAANEVMLRRLNSLPDVAARWKEAILKGEKQIVIPTLKVPEPLSLRSIHFSKTLRWFVMQALAAFITVMAYGLQGLAGLSDVSLPVVIAFVGIVSLIAFLYASLKIIKALRLWILHLPVDGSIRQIGMALRDTLLKAGLLQGAASRLPVQSSADAEGNVFIWLGGGSYQEQSIFSDAMEEILSPIEYPRYIVMRFQKRKIKFLQSVDFHAVPQILGAKKARAELFAECWEHRVGPTRLLYMRDQEGRRLLLMLRIRAFANIAKEKSKRTDRWA